MRMNEGASPHHYEYSQWAEGADHAGRAEGGLS